MTGPYAVGSEKGIPNFTKLHPALSRAYTISSVVSRSGSSLCHKHNKGPPFENAFSICLFIKLFGDFVVPNVLNNITEISLVRASIHQYGALETFPYEKDDIVAMIPKRHPLSKKTTPIEIEAFHSIPLAISFDISNTVYTVFGQHDGI